jgi:TRAP transporter 4TM/12TM fusion protein
MVDGPISIPLMKRTGFKAHFAAAVEAVASTGGQIMPPIMGAAAFVMAEFQGVSYAQIVIWATIPAILYYVACFSAVHFEAKRQGLLGVPRSELPPLGQTLSSRGHLFIPVLSILFVMYSGYSAPLAALTGTLLCFPVAWFGPVVLFVLPALVALPYLVPIPTVIPAVFGLHPLIEAVLFTAIVALWLWAVRHKIILLKLELRPIVDAMIDGARNTLPVALACAAAGIIIGIVILTGLGITFTQWVVGLSQNTLLLALVLTMAAGIILGMGMPTTPAYIVMVSLLVPALVKLGVVTPAAHMFAFYFAILSAITPPVALAVYAASGLAKSNLWKTGWAAVKIGAAGFVVPFMFVYEPALLMIGDWPTIVWRFIVSCIGIGMLAAGLHGYLLRPMPYWQRGIAIAAAFLLVAPELTTDILGFVMGGTLLAIQHFGQGAAKPLSGVGAGLQRTKTIGEAFAQPMTAVLAPSVARSLAIPAPAVLIDLSAPAPVGAANKERLGGAVFLSYRRADSADVTGRIYDRLIHEFGRDAVFKDVDSVPYGADFRSHLLQSIGESRLMLAVIGRSWLISADGNRRLEDPADMVRIELETAFERNIPVIPLLVQGASMPLEEEFPISLKQLAYRNGLPVRPDPDFRTDMDRLLKALRVNLVSQSG